MEGKQSTKPGQKHSPKDCLLAFLGLTTENTEQ